MLNWSQGNFYNSLQERGPFVKTPTLVCTLFLSLVAAPLADAASHAKRTPTSKPMASAVFTPVAERPARERLIKDHIVETFGHAFADPIVNDPRLAVPPPAPATGKPSRPVNRHGYSYMFTPAALKTGRAFLAANSDLFSREEEVSGVPAPIVNALLGAEYSWGHPKKTAGPVIVSLYKLAVVRPNHIRPGWPEGQLMAWLAICKKNGWDPFDMKGSWTGAFGLDQEEPTTYLEFSKGCVSKGNYSDPFSTEDAICRIAHNLGSAGLGKTRSSILNALWQYNHEHAYGRAILKYAALVRPSP